MRKASYPPLITELTYATLTQLRRDRINVSCCGTLAWPRPQSLHTDTGILGDSRKLRRKVSRVCDMADDSDKRFKDASDSS
jgi:hypothetical protein